MLNSKKIAIALLALVGIFVVAGPATADTNTVFSLKVFNKTEKKADADKGTKILLSLYDYNNKKRGSLQDHRIINPGEMTNIDFKFSSCYKTKHREFVINTVDSNNKVLREIAYSRIRMQIKDGCFASEVEFQDFTDIPGDNFKLTKDRSNGLRFKVYVKCESAGSCEQQKGDGSNIE